MGQRMITIVIPARNEEECIEETVTNIEKKVRVPHEIVIVDDNSTDKTVEKAKSLAKKYRNVRIIKRKENPGFGYALREGFSNAQGFAMVPMMADLCDEPETINEMYNKIDDFDIVVGSRYIKGGRSIASPFLKSWISRNYGRIMHWFVGIPTKDITNAFKMYRKDVIDAVAIERKDFSVSVELALKAHLSGFRITDIPTVWHGRKKGASKFKLMNMGKSYLSLFLYGIKKRLAM